MFPKRTPPHVEVAKFEAMLRAWPELMDPFLPVTINVHGGDPVKVMQVVKQALRAPAPVPQGNQGEGSDGR